MGRTAKYTYEQKLQACKDYLSGTKSILEIARELHMGKYGKSQVQRWVYAYQKNGSEALLPSRHNQRYSKEFKEQVVQEYLNGLGSLLDLTNKHHIRSAGQIKQWIKKYNSHIELKDYDPHPEVYMADRKKTSQEERIKIVQDCIEHKKDYKKAALKYGCSYSQVYDWVRKYEGNGEDGLFDKRGRHKKDEELTELEATLRRAKKVEEQVRRLEVENEFLKKLNAYGRK